MAGKGITDRVAIIGMGCTEFGEIWDKSASDLIVDAAYEAIDDAGLNPADIDAYWLATMSSGVAGLSLAEPLKIQYKPVTRIENLCASGSDALRNACYAVASGVYDIVMVVGVEKLKDSGYSGLVIPEPVGDGAKVDITAPAAFALLASAYFKKYGISAQKGKEVLARIAYKNHRNGALNPRAQYKSEIPIESIIQSPIISEPLGIMDCSGIADGAAAAIIVRSEDVKKYKKNAMYIKGLSVAVGPNRGSLKSEFDFTSIPENVAAAESVYRQSGINDPCNEIDLAEVHDCFTSTELIIYEDLGFSKRGQGWQDVLEGKFDLDGYLPVNTDGGLKACGHPIGASGLRMMYEIYLQLQDKAGPRQIENVNIGLTHNLGGYPWHCVCFMSILGKSLS